MQFGCAIFLGGVIGGAGAILAALSLLFWHVRTPPDLQSSEIAMLPGLGRRSPSRWLFALLPPKNCYRWANGGSCD
jgi:hypothetical protein